MLDDLFRQWQRLLLMLVVELFMHTDANDHSSRRYIMMEAESHSLFLFALLPGRSHDGGHERVITATCECI